MKALQRRFAENPVVHDDFNWLMDMIWCLGHSVNRCSQRLIEGFGGTPPADGDSMAPLPPSTNPIANVRAICRSICGSPGCRDAWEMAVCLYNARARAQNSIHGVAAVLPIADELQLLLDIKTRWDSTFYMVHRFLEMEPVCSLSLLMCHSAEFLHLAGLPSLH